MQRLRSEAMRFGVRIHIAHLEDIEEGLRGFYDHDEGIIYVDIRLAPSEGLEVIAHELGHAIHCHDCDSPAGERQANRYAAEILVDANAYARVEKISGDPEVIADELGVTVDVIRYYQNYCLTRVGAVTYARPKMGSNQYAVRELAGV